MIIESNNNIELSYFQCISWKGVFLIKQQQEIVRCRSKKQQNDSFLTHSSYLITWKSCQKPSFCRGVIKGVWRKELPI